MSKVAIGVRREALRVLVTAAGLWLLEIGCGGRILGMPGDGLTAEVQPNVQDEGGLDARATANAKGGSDGAPTRSTSTDAQDELDAPTDAGEIDGAIGDTGDVTDAFWCGDVQAVPECVAYQQLLEMCFMRDVDFACQSTLLPVGDADVPNIQQLCADNFQRLQSACR